MSGLFGLDKDKKLLLDIEKEIKFDKIEDSGVNDDNDVSESRREKRRRKREERRKKEKLNEITVEKSGRSLEYVQDAYIRGYDTSSLTGDLELEMGIGEELSEEQSQFLDTRPLHKYEDDHFFEWSMYTNSDNLFRYSPRHDYEDPTYMVFNIKILEDTSPLFGFNGTTSMRSGNSAEDFIRKYDVIPEIEKRGVILNTFQEKIRDIFDVKKYYIQQLGGLNKLTAKMVDYEKDLIEVTLSEDVALRSSFLAELYNNLCYSYKNQRYLIPDNCLRFDLMIELRDIRVFKIKAGEDFQINTNYPRIIYILRDCNFNFFEVVPIAEQSSIAGYSTQTSTTPMDLKFNIRYKSIDKEFLSSLADFGEDDAIKLIRNKQENIINEPLTSLSGSINDIKQDDFRRARMEVQNIVNRSRYTTSVEGDTILSGDDGFLKNVKNVAIDRTDQLKNELKREYKKVRGELINSLVNTIRGGTDELGFTRIYPSNVYHEDFGRNASIQNFLKGLGSDLTNLGEDSARDFLNNLPI